MSQIQQELIDAYLRNELSGSELTAFEHKLASDPAFREEIQFEQYVKEGISGYRKAELKARMNAIEIAPVGFGGGMGSAVAVKTIGGFLLAGILGTATYFLMESDGHSANSSIEYLTGGSDAPEMKNLPEIVVPEMATPSEPVERPVIARPTPEKTIPPVAANPENEEEYVPNVNVPDLQDPDIEEALRLSEVEIPEASRGDEVSPSSEPVDVKTEHRKSEKITYKYFDGKLFLYGDFKERPYEILEINAASGRKLYLYFDAQFYGVEVSDKVEELPRITDPNLIKDLEILRNNKLSE